MRGYMFLKHIQHQFILNGQTTCIFEFFTQNYENHKWLRRMILTGTLKKEPIKIKFLRSDISVDFFPSMLFVDIFYSWSKSIDLMFSFRY